MNEFNNHLEYLKSNGLYRNMNYLSKAQDTYTIIENKRVLLMASNNYLGLCNDKRLKEIAISTINKFGVGSGGSRLTTGSYSLHRELEQKIAEFKGTEASIIFNTGYMANIGTISAITDENWVIFSDELNHASIIDGCKLSKAKIVIYNHCDIGDLEKKIKKYGNNKGLVITDGVFSMDGDIAPLDKIVSLCKKYNMKLMVDDAHATGCLGENGSGTAEYFGIKDGIHVQMGTLSKAVGSEGAYVAGSRELIEYLRHKARSFIYSTALSPSVTAVALEALNIIENMGQRRKTLKDNSRWFQEQLISMGFKVIESETPIIPVIIGEENEALEFSKRLFYNGIYIPAIRPPTVPKGTSRLRIVLMGTHSKEDLKYAVKTIYETGKELKII